MPFTQLDIHMDGHMGLALSRGADHCKTKESSRVEWHFSLFLNGHQGKGGLLVISCFSVFPRSFLLLFPPVFSRRFLFITVIDMTRA